jgi:hypothetical protein
MILKREGYYDEQNARGGTFDITGTSAVTDKQIWGFNASEGAVFEVIKGVAIGTNVSTLTEIRAAEVDVPLIFLTALTDELFGSVIYTVDGYIITSIKLTSGSLHCYKQPTQITAA